MDRIRQIFYMTKTAFLEERHNKRVIMGFLLGMALFGYWLNCFLRYALDIGEPVNVLEAFVVVEHHNKSILFLAACWLLMISDAPFIKKNTYLSLYRSSRKRWDAAMLQYIMIQAFLYVAGIAALSAVVSSLCGFFGNLWSSPVYNLAMDTGNHLGVKYNISFPWVNIMQAMTVPQAFMITFIFLFLYLVLIGFLLYVCNLLLKETYGILLVFGIQISGYLLQQEGVTNLSLMAKAIPGYAIDGNGGAWRVVALFCAVILILALISFWLIGRVDFKDEGEE